MYKLFSVFDVDIKVNTEFFIYCFVIFVFSLFSLNPWHINNLIVFLFLSVILHEFGHILVARKFGISCNEIILMPLGGVAVLKHVFRNEKEDFYIAIAGPITSLLFSFIFEMKMLFLGNDFISEKLVLINFALFFYNLMPIGVLDGGRILKYFLSKFMFVYQACVVHYYLSFIFSFFFLIFNFNIFNCIIVFFILSYSFREYSDFVKTFPILKVNYEILTEKNKNLLFFIFLSSDTKDYIRHITFSNFCMYLILFHNKEITNQFELEDYFKKYFGYMNLISSGNIEIINLLNEFFSISNEFVQYEICEEIVAIKLKELNNE